MAFTKEQQIDRLIKTAENILVLLPAAANGDHIGSAWALAHFLSRQGKQVTVAGQHLTDLEQRFKFLPAPERRITSLVGLRDFVVSFSTTHNKILKVRTETSDSEYHIYVTPEHGAIDPRDFSILPVKFHYDCLIVLGAPDKESLGTLYEENPDIFFEVPIINIDHHSGNESFGQINCIDITASSVSEILVECLERLSASEPFDLQTAECLLTGIMCATESFQKKNTTPKTFHTAAKLVALGVDQQALVHHLFKTQPFNLLKLWGRAMANIRIDEPYHLLWGMITAEDLVQTRTSLTDIPLILEKIKNHFSTGSVFLLLFPENKGVVHGIMMTQTREALDNLHTRWPHPIALRDETLEFSLPATTLAEAESTALTILRNILPQK